MGVEFKIDFTSLGKKLLNETKEAVEDTTNAVYSDVRAYSPIDTGKYLSGHRNKGIKIEGNQVIGEVENIGEYSERVEGGFRKTPVNWNRKNRGDIYYSKGANVYELSVLKNKDRFINQLKKG